MGFVQQFKSELLNPGYFDFESECLKLFHFQSKHNFVYRDYIQQLKINTSTIKNITQIPFLPVTFFKNFKVVTDGYDFPEYFESSGTTGSVRSRLYYHDKEFYLQNSLKIFESFFGSISQYSFFFLLPNYLERQHSSLVSMASRFHSLSDQSHGGFYLHDFKALHQDLRQALADKTKKVILWGVTFALLDFAEQYSSDYKELIIFETGGMKGRGKEPLRSEVHTALFNRMNVSKIHSEYGMTELFSQAYSTHISDIFSCPYQMRILIREPQDPLNVHNHKWERGGVNVIDLANADTCAFIETQDIGIITEEGFRILGRFDNSEVRGCNLLVIGT